MSLLQGPSQSDRSGDGSVSTRPVNVVLILPLAVARQMLYQASLGERIAGMGQAQDLCRAARNALNQAIIRATNGEEVSYVRDS